MGRRNLVAASTLQWEGSTMQVHRKQVAWRKPIISFLIAAFVLGAGWNNRARSETINIGWTGEYWSTLPFRVAADKGFFEKEGLQARLITMRTALITPALMQGDLDYTVALPSIAGAALHGVPAKILGVVSKGTGYAIVSKSDIETVQGLKGKKFGINSFGASDDYTVYTFLSKSGLDPTRDVTLLSIGGTSARFAALTAGVVDAAAVSSPFEYKAEQSGLRILVPFKETAEYVKLSNAGLAATQAKLAKDGGQIVRTLRALRAATLFIQEQRTASVDLLAKTLRLDGPLADKLYPVYREQYNPELTVPDSVLEEYKGVASFRIKDKEKLKDLPRIQTLRDWSFAEKASQ
jgi:ABC-type nitrate/sulfonate/bicarbonate transport system substrate-binding protein